jgi:pimeloyl-CoA synthetase
LKGHKIHERLNVIEQTRIEALKAKEKELAEKKRKRLLKKENMTNNILSFGLCQSKEELKLHQDFI